MKKNLFMYDSNDVQIITYFQMELGFTLKYDILPLLISRYQNVQIYWEDFNCKIETDNGLYTGITIEIDTKSMKIYKNNRLSDLKNIYMYFDRQLKTIRNTDTCDSITEYDWLIYNIATPLNKVIHLMEHSKITNAFLLDKEIEIETKLSRKEHTHWVLKLNRFAKEIEKIYGYEVIFHSFLYNTLDFYAYSRIARIEINLKDNETLISFDYTQLEGRVLISSTNRANLYKHQALIHVAKRLYDIKEYSLYDRKILQEEYAKLKESSEIQ